MSYVIATGVFSTVVSIVSLTMVSILFTNNAGTLLTTFTNDVNTLASNATALHSAVPDILVCQSLLDTAVATLNACIENGYANCSNVTNQEVILNQALSNATDANLTATYTSFSRIAPTLLIGYWPRSRPRMGRMPQCCRPVRSHCDRAYCHRAPRTHWSVWSLTMCLWTIWW